MINEKIKDLKEIKMLAKRIKENIAYADIYQLESLTTIDGSCKSAIYSDMSKSNQVGVVDYERKMFYSFEDDVEFPIKKEKLSENLSTDDYDENDLGEFFVLRIDKSNLPNLSLKDLYYYCFKYVNYLKNVKVNSKKKKVYQK